MLAGYPFRHWTVASSRTVLANRVFFEGSPGHLCHSRQWGSSGVFCIGISGLGECGARDIGAGTGHGQAISACDPRRYIGDTGWLDEGERSARRRGSP
jgi:hypothetical protein